MEFIWLLVVVGTAIWVAVDASNLGAHRGRLGGGFLDMGPVAWFFAVLLFWIIGLPAYLVVRPKLAASGRASAAVYWGSTPYAAPASQHPSFASVPAGHPAAAPSAPDSGTVASLERLAQLRSQGMLSDEEFQAAKQRVIAGPR